MVRHLAEKLAAYITNNDDSADFEVLAYGYDVLIQEVLVFAAALLLAIPFNVVSHVLTALISYNLLRRYAGGVHAKHRAACIVSSVAIMFGPALFFARTGLYLSRAVIIGLYAVTLVMLLLYAPADTETKPVHDPARRRGMKLKAAVVLAVYLTASLLALGRLPGQASVLAVTAAFVGGFTHPWAYRLYGCEKSKILTTEVSL